MRPGQRLRRVSDGQAGFLVEDQGAIRVRLDRGKSDPTTIPFREHEWLEDSEPPPNAFQIARLQYALDREWRLTLGGEFNVPQWRDLKDSQRTGGFKLPAGAHPMRKRLYEAVRKELG